MAKREGVAMMEGEGERERETEKGAEMGFRDKITLYHTTIKI